MNLIQASTWFPPDSFGGVEVYLDGLIQDLRTLGLNSKVAAARSMPHPLIEQYQNTEVYRYPTDDLKAFQDWLARNQSDIYHQHTIRPGCGIPHLRSAKQLGMKTITTIHMPDITCIRGTMLQGGYSACDGKIEIARCSACLGVSKRVPAWASEALSYLPKSVAVQLRDRLRQSSDIRFRQLGTTVSTPAQVRAHRQQFEQIVELSDRIVVVSQWLYDAFVLNGVPESQLIVSRHGVSTQPVARTSSPSQPIQIGYLGRWQEDKGVQVLVEALQLIPNAPVELILHATHADQHGIANRDRVMAIANQDPRIQIKPPLSRTEISQAMANFDLLAAPSQCLETGPLVVLEAFAAGTPVIGSNLGGIAESVRPGIDGVLLPASDRQAWATAIANFAQYPETIAQLQQNIPPVKTRQAVAQEMFQLYQSLMREH